jgi:DNA-binding LytR/AlgR family response regulator
MKKLSCILLDDEPLATDIIAQYLKHFPFVELKSIFHNSKEAKDYLKKNPIDLLILDIEMPGLTGIELVKSLESIPTLIFTTAYPNFAVEGFELQAFDYLLKPVGFERFTKSMDRLHKKISSRLELTPDKNTLNEYIFVKADRKLQKVYFNEIQFIEGLKDYVMIHTTQGRIITLQTMKYLSEKLPNNIFRRIHRSYIINLNCIQSTTNHIVEIECKAGKKQLPIGKLFRNQLSSILEQKKFE